MALLSLGIAMPTLNAQVELFCLTDLKPACAKHLNQEIKAIHVDVCKKPEKTLGSLATSTFQFKAPELLFSREAMIFRTVNFVFSPYDNKIDAVRNWRLQVNFGAGGSFVDIPSGGTTITITYPTDTPFNIKYKGAIDPLNPVANTDNISGIDSTELFIKAVTNPYTKPDAIWKIDGGYYTPPNYANLSYESANPVLFSGKAEGFAYIKLGEGHTQITNPVVIVDGVDFNSEIKFEDNTIVLGSKYESKVVRCGTTGWDIFSSGAEDSWLELGQTETYREFPKLFQDLNSAKYDIIFLDFTEGATFIQKNAMVLKALLNRINATKVADEGGIHENIVIGASMGGQVVRMALAQMERDKQPHCTRMYVSFDSPQKGANIPLGLQAISWLLKFENLPETFSGNWSRLNMPAAKQMLTETLGDAVINGKVTVAANRNGVPVLPATLTSEFRTNTLRSAYLQEMAALGYPRQAQNIAIVDGNTSGKKMTGDNDAPFPDNASMMNATPSLLGSPFLFNAQLFALNGSVNLPGSANGTFFKAKMPECFYLSSNNPVQELQVSFKLNQSFPNLDNAPGCIRGDFRGLRRMINSGQTTLNKKTGGLANIIFPAADFQPNFCFMPTVSTLDIRDPKDSNKWNWYVNPNILTDKIDSLKLLKVNTHLTPFFDYYAPLESLRHVEANSEMRAWVMKLFAETEKDDLDFTKELPSNGLNTYNLAYRKNRISTVTINPEGTLKINDEGKSAFNNPSNFEKNLFDAYLGGDCAGNIVTINGGTLQIGSAKIATRSATLGVGAKTQIVMNSGTLALSNESKIFIQSGGEVILKGGTLKLTNLSQIVVENGGKLIIYPEVNVILQDVKTEILVSGTLHLKGVRNNTLQNAQENFRFMGNGHFAFNPTNVLKMEDDNKSPVDFKWIGDGKSKNFIVLNPFTDLKIPSRNVQILKASIQYNLATKIEMKNGKSLILKEVTAYGNQSATAFRIEEGAGDMYIYNCDFNGLNYGIDIYAAASNIPKSTSSYSTSNSYNVAVNTNVNFTNCYVGFSAKNNSGHIAFYNKAKFSGNRSIGVFVGQNGGHISFDNCQMEENAIGAMIINLPRTTLNITNSYIGRNAYGVVLKHVKNAVFSSSIIENHDDESFIKLNNTGNEEIYNLMSDIGDCSIERATGILDLANSNIIITDATRVANNNFGVYKNNEKIDAHTAPDVLILDCSKFINNIYGVKGKSIALQADATFNQSQLSMLIRPNSFIQGEKGIAFFDICYEDSPGFPVPSQIFIRENYWDTKANGQGKAPDPMTINFKNECLIGDQACEHCSNTKSCIPYETAQEASDYVEGCPAFKPNPKDPNMIDVAAAAQCNTIVKGGVFGEKTPVHAQFRSAYATLLLGKKADVDYASKLFQSIAELPLEKENSECNHYITMARAFIDYYPQEGDGEIPVRSKIQKTPSNILIYPNPTSDVLNIRLPKGNFDINITDNQGRKIYETSSEYETIINTNNWSSGIYQVTFKNKTTGVQEVQKVAVMKGN
jgi:hypothetical protein